MSEQVKWGASVPVLIKNGVPRCPHCGEPMEPRDGDLWRCPVGAAPWDAIANDLARALDRIVQPKEQQ